MGFTQVTPLRALEWFYEFWLVARCRAADSDVLADGFHRMTYHES